MNNIEDMRKIIKAQRFEEIQEKGIMTLGELEARLSAMPPDAVVRFRRIYEHCYPHGFDSYRGYYEDICLEPEESEYEIEITSEVLARRAKEAIGQTFTGYKGGDYKMSRMTPVWVSPFSVSSGYGITGVTLEGNTVYIEIEQMEY